MTTELLRIRSAHVNAKATEMLRIADKVEAMERIVRVLRDPDGFGSIVALTNSKFDMSASCAFVDLSQGTREIIAKEIENRLNWLVQDALADEAKGAA